MLMDSALMPGQTAAPVSRGQEQTEPLPTRVLTEVLRARCARVLPEHRRHLRTVNPVGVDGLGQCQWRDMLLIPHGMHIRPTLQ